MLAMYTLVRSNDRLIYTMTQQANNKSALDTQEKILDAAECLFVEHGFAATSMRAIANTAGVNLAATNYHFGSKQGLLASVLHRCIAPINQQRLLLLEGLMESERILTTRLILEAFFSPVRDAVGSGQIPALMGRMYAEPKSLTKPILEREFGEVAWRYQQALASVLPAVPADELRWRFHFMIGSMIHLLQFHAPLGSESSEETFIFGLERLIEFSEAGLAQSTNEQQHD